MAKENQAAAVDISMVVASGAGGEFMSRCLGSIRDQVEAKIVFRRRHLVGKFLLALVVVAYVVGEWLGYLEGVGDAPERVE